MSTAANGAPPQTSIYLNRSIELVRRRHSEWGPADLAAAAKRDWEAAAKVRKKPRRPGSWANLRLL